MIEDFWESIEKEMWALGEKNNGISLSLMISYLHLTFPLKRCFAYCCVFPNGYEYDKDELVQMWIAEGLVQPSGRRRLEDIGCRYFNYLLCMSFFETTGKHEIKYRMSSLFHDLACHVSKNELLVMEDDELLSPPEQPRYASVHHQKEIPLSLGQLNEYKSLRALKLFGNSLHVRQVPQGLLLNLERLRVLDFGCSDIEELPDSVGGLIHLRYLGLKNTRIEKLPESVSNLYNLKTLELSNCQRLLALPNRISNLANLRHLGLHLDWENIKDLSSMPPGIGQLTSLQTLSRFTVTNDDTCNIGELNNLKLRGELCISKLENIVNVSEAPAANLMGKKYIDKLMLRWTDTSANSQTCEEVIDKLCPHSNLKHLWIVNYPGRRSPSWLDRSFSNLETLRLLNCRECEIPLSFHEQLPNLKILR